MKNLLFNIIVLTSIILATNTKGCKNEPIQPGQNMYGTEQVFNQRQLDSAFVADTLNPNLDEWIVANFVDYETNEKIVKYLYIKENTNVRYTVMPKDTLFIYDKIEVKSE